MISSVDKAWTDDWLRRTPLGRMGTTEEVGKAVMALCSDQFTFMTGASLSRARRAILQECRVLTPALFSSRAQGPTSSWTEVR